MEGGRRKVATPPATLDDGLVAAANQLRAADPAGRRRPQRRRPVARRGRAHHLGAVGLLALAFPLHPPGRPE